jgi:hypothetical protein
MTLYWGGGVCAICLEIFEEKEEELLPDGMIKPTFVYLNPCRHVFHCKCYFKMYTWAEANSLQERCPTCKSNVDSSGGFNRLDHTPQKSLEN